MSQIHQCNDGTQDVTGRGTPDKVPCENNGGEVGTTPINTTVQTAGFGKIPNFVWGIIALAGVYYIGKNQKWF